MSDLPPGPFSYMTISAKSSTHPGAGHVYILDANERKIASIWGRQDEKIALAELIIKARDTVE